MIDSPPSPQEHFDALMKRLGRKAPTDLGQVVQAMTDAAKVEAGIERDTEPEELRAPQKEKATEMTELPSRAELDAKLERTEARVESELAKHAKEQRAALDAITSELKLLHADLAQMKGWRSQIWISSLTAAGIVIAVLGYGTSMFESGRNTAEVVKDAQAAVEGAARDVKKTQEQTQNLIQDALRAVGATQPSPR